MKNEDMCLFYNTVNALYTKTDVYIFHLTLLLCFSLPSPSVYNCVTGELAANTWGNLVENLFIMARAKPLPHSYLYPAAICCKNPVLYNFLSLLLHYVPAVIADMLLWISGSSFR